MKLFLVISGLILFTNVLIAQSKNNENLIRLIERNVSFPDEAYNKGESCVVLLQIISDNGKKSLIILNEIPEYFRKETQKGLELISSKIDLNQFVSNSIIPVLFLSNSPVQGVGLETKISTVNLTSLLREIYENQNGDILKYAIIMRTEKGFKR